ncbi:hypothetical protein GQF56_21070 [Rhodobacter sphaeroides]|jgi:hypothetical protein|uniref:Uncharacterized protein n=1 Tax=Cereibacter sphaeroides (strain ATCC 17023 / DSM 158 / JCM 6121 / CCUG 31486 / LMG 2827 / NBRC 12203 / NCIMB 8253 / ATH 2.4.1.) TaxID=272943 RepID=Q3IV03_CERS4|nr:hypothetical protein [Cereibacter sphaeroides]ABA81631.1 hypothetical protein RSP_4171 [Cereibacter sphaeroides 2.4.1]AMJ49774.1 hypothetical protein APX01_19620 [Cereibacter sphaeroides]ANS36533.1 hypothetical protein A3858_19900 [Cereibacter sphaeroides]ATN65545.1 hypothetical protein A3857_19645 [Cereibacter sphaeroides]AXC64158.1 hypothetical protein DQL45_22600 [Cereibacter sphaeroides 2.4.1]
MLWFFYLVVRVFVGFLCLAAPLMVQQASLWVYVLFWPSAVAILMLGLLDPRYLLRRTIAAISTTAITGFLISGLPPLTEAAIADDTLREVLNLMIVMVTGRMSQDCGWPLVSLVSFTLLILAALEVLRTREERPKDARFVARPVPSPVSLPYEEGALLLSLGITVTNVGKKVCTINPRDVRIRVCWLWTVAASPSLENNNDVLPLRAPLSLQPAETCTLHLDETIHSRILNQLARLPRWLTWLLLWGDVDVAGEVFSTRFPSYRRLGDDAGPSPA